MFDKNGNNINDKPFGGNNMKSEKENNRNADMPRGSRDLADETNEKQKGKTESERRYVETDEKNSKEPKQYLH